MSRLTGISVILVLAAGGVAAYLITTHPTLLHSAAPLSTKVVSNETIGLVAQNVLHGSPQLLQLRGPGGIPQFSAVTPAEEQTGSGQWTADQMGDGSYIFIFVPSGTCLTAVGKATLALRHCDLQPNQRWRRAGRAVLAQGHDFYQYANLSTSKCMTELSELPGPSWKAQLEKCSLSSQTNQLIAFWWASA
ncbi:MAG TPA: hypothetical protein VH520_01475 [Streptosporangiaceae bacterium]